MNTLDILEYGHKTLISSLDALPFRHWETAGVCGYWSLKEIVAHLASYEQMHVDVMHTLLEDGAATPTLDLMFSSRDKFNDVEVARRSASKPSAVFDQYKVFHDQLMRLAGQLSSERFTQNGILPWYGEEYCLNDFLIFTSYGHKREHSAQVNVFRDSLTT